MPSLIADLLDRLDEERRYEFEERAGETGSVIDRATGERFRSEFLSVGASRPALESFVAFRGRKPDPQALLRSHGLI